MIIKTFEFSVAAAATASNVMPDDFNPIPDNGVLDIYGVLDSGISSLTAPPTVELVLGGSTSSTPLRTSSVTGDPYALQTAGNFGDPSVNQILSMMPVRQGTNIALNLAGGTGATATGRFKVVYRTAQEVTAGVNG